jgi:hypothetical protein
MSMNQPRHRAAIAAVLAASALMSLAPPAMATDVGISIGISIGISQPGVYGRIDIGRFPNPVVVAPQPVIIVPPPPPAYGRPVVVAPPQPVHLWVPPGHQKNWRKHCHRYGACGVPVYFVRDEWYRQHVLRGPGREHPGRGHGKGKGRD